MKNSGTYRYKRAKLLSAVIIVLFFIFFSALIALGQSPGGVNANLAFWVKANTSVYSNNAGTTPSTDLGVVAVWKDNSGNARNASQATLLNQPIFDNNLVSNINYNPVVTFNGLTTYLKMTATNGCLSTGNNSYSVYMLIKPTAVVAPGKIMSSGTCTGTANEFLSFDLRPTLTIDESWNLNDNIAANNQYTLLQPILLSFLYQTAGGANNDKLFLNGTLINTRSAGTGGTGGARNNANSNNGIGCQLSCLNEFFNGSIAEIASYTNISHAGTATQNEVESYLALKYGITLGKNGSTTSAYVNTSNTTIWAANTGYHNDVIGIGNETNDVLDQPKSITANLAGALPNDVIVIANSSISIPVSLANGQYVTMGNNAGSIAALTTVANFTHGGHLFSKILPRVWRAQITGNPAGNFEVQVDMTRVNGGLTFNNEVALILDNNTTYGQGAAQEKSYTPNTGFLPVAGLLTFTVPYADMLAAQATGTPFFSLAVAPGPLPVKLIYFGAKPVSNYTQIEWKTATEINNHYFEIQKSANGSDFKAIAVIQGSGNSVVQNNYTYRDFEQRNGTSYYRLKQVDFNGNYEYSNIISVSGDIQTSLALTLSPNPASDYIQLKAVDYLGTNADWQIEIYDIYSRLVNSTAVKSYDCGNLPIPIAAYLRGVYILKVVDKADGQAIFTGRFNKVE